MKIGFIGLGLMGEAMASNIIQKHSEPVYVFDVDPAKIKVLEKSGGKGAASAKEIAAVCDVVISMVPKSVHVQTVYDEMADNMRPNQVYIDMSTIDPKVSVELSKVVGQKGAVMLDAPVVKSRPAALEGKLGIYVGGDKNTYESVRFILEYMGCSILYMGGNGSGLTMKILHNMMVAQIQNAVNETLSMAEYCNIGYDQFAQASACGGGQNFYLDSKLATIQKKDYEAVFSVENMDKDVNIAVDMAKEKGMNYPGMNLVQQLYSQAMTDGGKKDFSYLYEIVLRNAK